MPEPRPVANGSAAAARVGSAPRRCVPLGVLAWEFLKIGATNVGDTGPLLAYLERDLVDRRGLLTHQDVTDALTYTKLLPGSTVVQIVAYLAYLLGGWPGSLVATVAYLLPASVLMVLLAAGYMAAATAIPTLGPAINGLTAAVVGVLLATTYRLAKRSLSPREPVTILLALAAFVAGAFWAMNAALIVIVGGLLGILLFRSTGQSGRVGGG